MCILRRLGDERRRKSTPPANFLERLDLGDETAENEETVLDRYFVKTAQFREAKRGFARLVVGRKGAGKTAMFYVIRNSVINDQSQVTVELKPGVSQFLHFREVVLAQLSSALQEHTLAAFWNYILLCEIAHRIIETEFGRLRHQPGAHKLFFDLKRAYQPHGISHAADFSERLLGEIDRIVNGSRSIAGKPAGHVRDPALCHEGRHRDQSVCAECAEYSAPVRGR